MIRHLVLSDPDLEAEAVAGVTLRRLTRAGTVPVGTLRSECATCVYAQYKVR